MQVVYSPDHIRHQPATFILRGAVVATPEVAARAETFLKHLGPEHRVIAPDDHGPRPRAAVHTPEYLEFLETIHAAWMTLPGASSEIVPNVHPGRHMSIRPTGPVGLVGYHTADTACPITAGTWPAVVASANTAVHAAELVLAGAPVAYALCRPPGHHAYADMAGGFCYLNNSAIAAQHLRGRHGRVAILDVDVHHGNGTQGIFYERADVLTVSIHADPQTFYPWFTGYAHERGAGAGLGYNLNLPLPHGSSDAVVLGALDHAFAAIRGFAPDVLVVALGFDGAAKDPVGVFKISTDGFAQIARRVAGLGLPSLLVQEGGYMNEDLGPNLHAFLGAFEAGLRRTA